MEGVIHTVHEGEADHEEWTKVKLRDEQARGTSASSLSDKITLERQNETLCLYS